MHVFLPFFCLLKAITLNPSEQAFPMHKAVDMFSLSQRSTGSLDFVQVPTVKLNSTQSLESKFSTTQLLSEPEMSLDLGSQLRKLS